MRTTFTLEKQEEGYFLYERKMRIYAKTFYGMLIPRNENVWSYLVAAIMEW